MHLCPSSIRILFSSLLAAVLLRSRGPALPQDPGGDLEGALGEIRKLGGFVERDEGAAGKPVIKVRLWWREDVKVKDEDLRHLAALPDLAEVDLSRVAGLGPRGMEHLKALAKLRVLRLSTDIGAEGIERFEQLNSLKTLDLWGGVVRGPFLSRLKRLAELRELEIILRIGETDEPTLDEVSAIPGLRRLSLPGATDAGLKHVVKSRDLESLSLDSPAASPAGLGGLRASPRLKSLILSGEVSDDGLGALAGWKALESLELRATEVTDAGLALLSRLEGLRALKLYENLHITDVGLARLQGLAGLRRLSLYAKPYLGADFSDAGLRGIAGLKDLEWLELNSHEVTDAGLDLLAGLAGLRELILLCPKVSVEAVERLRQALPQCKVHDKWRDLK